MCGFSFTHQRNLTRHMERHTIQKKFKCSVCSKAFHRKDHQRRHERLHGHPSNPPVRRVPAAAAAPGEGGRKIIRGRSVRGSGATVPTTRSRRATTAAATTRQRMSITRLSSAFNGACISWRLEFPNEIKSNADASRTTSHGANVQIY